MKKSIWDRFAPVYSLAMKSQQSIYDYMYARIRTAVEAKDVLELATGPGLIAKHVAGAAAHITATDFSPQMIAQAKKGSVPENLTFEIADASSLQYADKSFDVVIIANALHIVPEPEKVLAEIDRVLKAGGILIAPNFIHRTGARPSNRWAKLLKLLGIRFQHEWTAEAYTQFLAANGWEITASQVLPGRIDLLYAECARRPCQP